MKRVITVLLAVLLVLSLAACGSGVETKKLAGTWTCMIDVTDRMNAAAEQALGLSAADGTAQMPLQLVLTVTEDGAYTLRYDSDAARTALDAYAAALHPAAVESVYAAAEEQGLSREEYDAAMEKAGITMDDMVAAIFAGVDEEELLSLLTGGADFSQWQWVLREAVYDAGGSEVRAAVAINYGSFLSTILSRSSACGTFSTPPYSRTLSNDISKQVFPNSRTEYIVDVLSLPLKIAKRIGMPLLSDINCANILYFPLSSKKPRFFLKVLLFSVIPFDA